MKSTVTAATIKKTVKVDARISERFGHHCGRLGLIQERVVEALLAYGLGLDAAELGRLLGALQQWKEAAGSGPLPDGGLECRQAGRAAP